MRKFTCDNCRKPSRFLKQKVSMILEFKIRPVSSGETRSYECEHCGTENRITQPPGAWAVIDAGLGT